MWLEIVKVGSAIQAEATAALGGMIWAKSKNFCRLVCETVSEVFFKTIFGSISLIWEIHPLLQSIKSVQSDFVQCSWSLVRRETKKLLLIGLLSMFFVFRTLASIRMLERLTLFLPL